MNILLWPVWLLATQLFLGTVLGSADYQSQPALLSTKNINSPAQSSSRDAAVRAVSSSNNLSAAAVQASPEQDALIDFAKCLSSRGAVMYGAYWCPHCAEQKATLGGGLPHIKYIECDAKSPDGRPELCQKANIQSYPTWIMPRQNPLIGSQTLAELSTWSGCPSTATNKP